MLRTLIRLSDGTEISSGSNESMNIRSCTITQCVNSGDDLTIGSVCAACVEMVVEAPANTFNPDDTFTLFKVDDAGNRTQIGIFNVFTPEKKGERLCRVTAYDNVIKLDTDLTEWFGEYIKQPPDDPVRFIDDICGQCGVRADQQLRYSECHNIGEFNVKTTVTGRKLLGWVAEMLGYFCTAGPNGDIVFGWYRDNTQVVLRDKEDRYRLQGSHKHKNVILPVDGVLIKYDKDQDGVNCSICQTPAYVTLSNPYIIQDNPILDSKTMPDMFDIADHIWEILSNDRKIYECNGFGNLAACEVSIPASIDVNVGDIIVVVEQDPGEQNTFKNCMRVMTKIQKGQKDTLYCTGSYRRRN